jgi:hypothetical protein
MVTAYFRATSRKPGVVRSFCIVTFCLLGSVRAASAVSPVTSPGMLCDQAIVAAEQRLHLPSGILAAVGRAETGRADQAGKAHPWPYTINAEGTGTFFATKQAAVAAIEELQSRGVRSIDVGSTRKIGSVKAKPKTFAEQCTAHGEFRFRVASFHFCHHCRPHAG